MATRIYLVTPKSGPVRLVEAVHPANALRHVAAQEYSVEVASQQDLVDLISAGKKVERVGVEQAELPVGDEA